jgi:hypothetical protein
MVNKQKIFDYNYTEIYTPSIHIGSLLPFVIFKSNFKFVKIAKYVVV